MNNETSTINWMRVNNDVNGNPRYVCHYLTFITDKDRDNTKLEDRYPLALKKAKTIGGKKFHNKQYGGGIVFQSYNLKETETQINELLNK